MKPRRKNMIVMTPEVCFSTDHPITIEGDKPLVFPDSVPILYANSLAMNPIQLKSQRSINVEPNHNGTSDDVFDTERQDEIRRSIFLDIKDGNLTYHFTKDNIILVIKKVRRLKKLSRNQMVQLFKFDHKNNYVKFIRGDFEFVSERVDELAQLLVSKYPDIVSKYIYPSMMLSFTTVVSSPVWDVMARWIKFIKEPNQPTITVDSLGNASV